MTAISSAISATTPRSCVMITTAVSNSCCSRCDQLEDLRLHGDVERGRRLVGDQQLGVVGQRHRDHRALAHAARELVRVGVDALARLGDADEVEQLDRAVVAPAPWRRAVGADRLDELVAHLVERDAATTAGPGRSSRCRCRGSGACSSLGRSSAGRGRRSARCPRCARGSAREAHDGEGGDALARARLADDAERLAAIDAVGDAVDRLAPGRPRCRSGRAGPRPRAAPRPSLTVRAQ